MGDAEGAGDAEGEGAAAPSAGAEVSWIEGVEASAGVGVGVGDAVGFASWASAVPATAQVRRARMRARAMWGAKGSTPRGKS